MQTGKADHGYLLSYGLPFLKEEQNLKFLHLSDLHIGKRVYGFSMLEDQSYILSRILEIAAGEKPDGVILAGDIYDKAVPSAEAVRLMDEFLTALAREGIRIFMVSGNHDSPERIAFGAELMKKNKVYVSPVYDGKISHITMEDEYGTVTVWLLPFIKPAIVRHVFPEQEIETYQDAVRTVLQHIHIDTAERNILVAHQFVTGAARCESEELFVGGIDNVDASLFDRFDYTALGHIHSPQQIGRPEVCYCGTPLKYSFSEAGQVKTVTVLELYEKGVTKLRRIPLIPLRDMRRLRGSYMEVTDRSFYINSNTEDYLQITLTDEEDIPDGMLKLRAIYPNLMRLEYDNKRTSMDQEIDGGRPKEQKTELELFEEFFALQNNRPMSTEQRAYSKKLLEELKEQGFKEVEG